jgi:hypothetical protein
MQCNLLYISRLQIGTLLAADRMCRLVGHVGQAGQTATQIVSCPQCKWTRTERLHRQYTSAQDTLSKKQHEDLN